ncbi:MAG: hypothetical protein QFB87_05115 [Patescibacteria group bacterium]|nr:hypothetical protein [Patescibacteria group bacterium]
MSEFIDRGDDLDPALAAAAAEAKAAEEAAAAATKAAEEAAAAETDKAAADKKAAEEAAAAAAAEEAAASKEDKPRDKDGKFTKEISIPKGRVDEMVKNERLAREAAERRALEAEEKLKATDRGVEAAKLEEEIVSLEKEHAKAILDGNADKAAELAGKIRLNERMIQNASSTQMSAQAQNQAREEIRLDLVIEKLEEQYPQLLQGSDSFDQDAVDLVLASQKMYIDRDRMTPSAALALAAEKVMAKLTVGATKQEKEEPEGLDKAKVTADRKEAQVDKNIKTAAAQPANLKDAGLDADKKGATGDIDPLKLSTAEFDALPEATKARLRGDTL